MNTQRVQQVVSMFYCVAACSLLVTSNARGAEESSRSVQDASLAAMETKLPTDEDCGAIYEWGRDTRWMPYNEKARLARCESERRTARENEAGSCAN